MAQRGLRAKVHVAEEQLAGQARGRRGCRGAVGSCDVLCAPVEVPAGEGSEVQMGGEQRG